MHLIPKEIPSKKICHAIEKGDVTLLPWEEKGN